MFAKSIIVLLLWFWVIRELIKLQLIYNVVYSEI